MHALLAFIAAHREIALVLVGSVALAESLAVIGTVVPAAVIMFAAGGLVGHGELGLMPTLACAALGAFVGDSLSYELGHWQQQRARRWAMRGRFASVFAHSLALVEDHGATAVLLARFMGPVRAFVPFIAGIGAMPRWSFYAIDAVAASLWAPAHILPGVLFGASLHLAETVSGRLAALVLLLVFTGWLGGRLILLVLRHGLPLLRRIRSRLLGVATYQRNALWARLTLAFLDPERPTSLALLVGAAIACAAGGVFLAVLEDVVTRDTFVQVDLSVFRFLQAERTVLGDRLMIGLTELGSVGVMLPLVVTVCAWLWARGRRRSAGLWAIAAIGAEAIVAALKVTLGRARPLPLYVGLERFSFPSGHATVGAVVLGLLAFLLCQGRSLRARLAITVTAAFAVALICISRLYLGAHWLSDVVAGVSIGLTWLATLIVVHAHTHEGQRQGQPIRGLGLVSLATIALAFAGWSHLHGADDARRYAALARRETLDAVAWVAGQWRRLPLQREEAGGEANERFDLQWACDSDQLAAQLTRQGWRRAAGLGLKPMLEWLVPNNASEDAAVLPRFDRGRPNRFAFVLPAADGTPGRLLRLWSSDYTLNAAGQTTPIWYGAIYERMRRPHAILTPGRLQERVTTRADARSVLAPMVLADGRYAPEVDAPLLLQCRP